MRISLLGGAQSSALGGAGAAARGRLPLLPSCLAALRSRSSLLFLSFFFVFVLGAALRSRFNAYDATAAGTTGQTPPDPGAETRPAASTRARDAHDLASPRPRVRSRRSSLPIAGDVDDAPGQEKRPDDAIDLVGGVEDAPGQETSPDAIDLARFAVAEHNSKTNAALEFVRLIKVRHQVVAGSLYYFTVEVREVDGGAGANYKLYEAQVWLKEWLNFKRLEAFEPVVDASNGDEGTTKK